MTKIGDGAGPRQPTVQDYHRQLDQATMKFENALISYQSSASTPEDKLRLKQVMDEQLLLIQSAIRELQRSGIYKQGQKVADDYSKFIQSNDLEKYAALEHDLQTLREYNQLP
jgi:hypothetical protein